MSIFATEYICAPGGQTWLKNNFKIIKSMKKFIVFLVCAALLPLFAACSGGYSSSRHVTDQDIAVFNEARTAYVAEHPEEADFVNSLVPKSVSVQTVEGRNFKFKCDKAIVFVFQTLPDDSGICTCTITDIQRK